MAGLALGGGEILLLALLLGDIFFEKNTVSGPVRGCSTKKHIHGSPSAFDGARARARRALARWREREDSIICGQNFWHAFQTDWRTNTILYNTTEVPTEFPQKFKNVGPESFFSDYPPTTTTPSVQQTLLFQTPRPYQPFQRPFFAQFALIPP